MRRDGRVLLWDIQQGAKAIRRFTDGVDAETYAQDDLIQAGVERKFEIIGEALNHLAKLDPDLAAQIPEHRAIIAFRNLLIHGYAAVDAARVWRITQDSLPDLQATVRRLLDVCGPPDAQP